MHNQHRLTILRPAAFSTVPNGNLLFLRSLIRNPLGIGAVAPSSPRLSRLIAANVNSDGSTVLEIGPGTGSITFALLEYGIAPERLFLIERDPELADYLRTRFPAVRVCCADAAQSRSILHAESVGQVKTIVSSLPLRNLAPQAQLLTMRAMLKALAPGGQLLQFSYSNGCPLPAGKLGLNVELVGRVWLNLPPASVWRFRRARDL